MLDWEIIRAHITEAVKISGGLASFYAVVKLRQIEKRYLFKATVPELLRKIEETLSTLNLLLSKPSSNRPEISENLNYLLVDVANMKRKVRGDSYRACKDLLEIIKVTQPRRYFWQSTTPVWSFDKNVLLEIYGKGRGLIRSLEHDVVDQGWGAK
jgi:hypothetical protein